MGAKSNCLRKVLEGKDGLEKNVPFDLHRTWSFSEGFHPPPRPPNPTLTFLSILNSVLLKIFWNLPESQRCCSETHPDADSRSSALFTVTQAPKAQESNIRGVRSMLLGLGKESVHL